MKIKTTIVTVYFNREDLVDESIESIIQQLTPERELIIIDDGSTDKTYEKLKLHEKNNVRIIKKENSGFTRSIRDAIDLARGKYVAVHGAGDYSLKGRFDEQEKSLDNNPNVVLCSSLVENVHSKSELNNKSISGDFFEGCATNKLLSKNFIVHGSVMFRKGAYEEVGGYRKSFEFAQDRDLWIRMSRKNDFLVLNKILYRKFKFIENSVSASSEKIFKQRMFSNYAVELHKYYVKYGVDLEEKYGLLGSSLVKNSFKTDLENIKVYISINKRFGRKKAEEFLLLLDNKFAVFFVKKFCGFINMFRKN